MVKSAFNTKPVTMLFLSNLGNFYKALIAFPASLINVSRAETGKFLEFPVRVKKNLTTPATLYKILLEENNTFFSVFVLKTKASLIKIQSLTKKIGKLFAKATIF